MPSVCVIGGGPSGCVFAARMAQLGHEVTLIERAEFPRATLGESLTPGVLPLLEMIGARAEIEAAGFTRVRTVTTTWDGGIRQREDPSESGLLVDRGRFDALLLDRTRALGVQVLQPATARGQHRVDGAWRLAVELNGRTMQLETDFLADATGRRGTLPAKRRRHATSTLALHAYWRGAALPQQPRIEAGKDAWYWGVPLPDGRYNTLVFVDASTVRASRGRPLDSLFHEYLARSGLMSECVDVTLDAPVLAIDATPYVDEECVADSSIKVGDAALAIDPLSSSGVQKAIQSALAGAIVTNTLLRRAESRTAAIQFYRTTVEETALRHRGWAASHYATVAARDPNPFWAARASDGIPARAYTTTLPSDSGVATRAGGILHERLAASLAGAVALSPHLEFIDHPCIDGEFVIVRPAVSHPLLDSPVAYLGTWPIEPLLRDIRAGMTALDVVQSWSDRVPPRSGLAIASWLLERQLLVPAVSAPVSASQRRNA